MFNYSITNTEYTPGLNRTLYIVRRESESKVIAYFSFLEHTSTIIELLDFRSNEGNNKDLELILIELLETYYNDRDYLLLHKELKECTKFSLESILDNYATDNTTYTRYQI